MRQVVVVGIVLDITHSKVICQICGEIKPVTNFGALNDTTEKKYSRELGLFTREHCHPFDHTCNTLIN